MKINILEKASLAPNVQLESVRITANGLPVILFSADGEEEKVHYCEEESIRGYVICNGTGCVLCKIGRKAESRELIPVYRPLSGDIAVLHYSQSFRPNTLKPQLMAILKNNEPVIVVIRKDDKNRFVVSTHPISKNTDGGECQIAEFQKRYDTGEISLASVFSKHSNDELLAVPEIRNFITIVGGN
jgi:hypothetical protein